MNLLRENWFNLLAAILLFWALADNPYGYYQLLRWVVTIIAIHNAYKAYNLERIGWTWVFGIIALLFNPILPFYLERDTWQIIDVIAGIVFMISVLSKKRSQTTEK